MSMIESIKRLKSHYRIIIAGFMVLVALAIAMAAVVNSKIKRGRQELLAIQKQLRIGTTRSEVDRLLRDQYHSLDRFRIKNLDLIDAEANGFGPEWLLYVVYDRDEKIVGFTIRTDDDESPQGAPDDVILPGLEEKWQEMFDPDDAR